MFTRQIKVQVGKSFPNIISIMGKMPSGGQETPLRPSLPSWIASFPSFDRKERVQSVGNEHQSGYSRADTKRNNINKRSMKFSIRGNQ